MEILSAIHQRISEKLRNINIHKYRINSVNPNSEGDSVKLSLYDLDKNKNINVNIDTSDLNITLRQGLDSLTEAIDEMNIDGIMAIVGIIQYMKITGYSGYVSAIDHANFVSDIKTVVEKVVGTSLMFMGVKIRHQHLSDPFRNNGFYYVISSCNKTWWSSRKNFI